MKNIFSRFLGIGKKDDPVQQELEVTEKPASNFTLKTTPEQAESHTAGMQEAFTHAVEKSPYIKESMKSEVISFLTSDAKDWISAGSPLTADEKKALGYNPRLKITRESLAILSDSALEAGFTPPQIIREIRINAQGYYHLKSQIEQMRAAGIKQYSVMSAGTGIECDWCKSINNKELEISQNFHEILEKNCQNEPYCKFTTKPVLDWDD